jgi:hypothetical protein
MVEGAGRKKGLIRRRVTVAASKFFRSRSSEKAQALAEYGITLAVFAVFAALVFRFVVLALGAMRSGVVSAAVHTGEFF